MSTNSDAEDDTIDPLETMVQYSDGMYIVANDALGILRRDIRRTLNLPEVSLAEPVCHMEMLLIFTVCHKTYNGAGARNDARLRRCVSDMEYMRRHIDEGLPDYVIRALQVGIDRGVLTSDLAETYAMALEISPKAIPDYADTLHAHQLPA
jgi:hypothetical protein